MSHTIKIRRGLSGALSSVTPAVGEPLFATDTKELRIGDGVTVGGNPIALPSAGGGSSQGFATNKELMETLAVGSAVQLRPDGKVEGISVSVTVGTTYGGTVSAYPGYEIGGIEWDPFYPDSFMLLHGYGQNDYIGVTYCTISGPARNVITYGAFTYTTRANSIHLSNYSKQNFLAFDKTVPGRFMFVATDQDNSYIHIFSGSVVNSTLVTTWSTQVYATVTGNLNASALSFVSVPNQANKYLLSYADYDGVDYSYPFVQLTWVNETTAATVGQPYTSFSGAVLDGSTVFHPLYPTMFFALHNYSTTTSWVARYSIINGVITGLGTTLLTAATILRPSGIMYRGGLSISADGTALVGYLGSNGTAPFWVFTGVLTETTLTMFYGGVTKTRYSALYTIGITFLGSTKNYMMQWRDDGVPTTTCQAALGVATGTSISIAANLFSSPSGMWILPDLSEEGRYLFVRPSFGSYIYSTVTNKDSLFRKGFLQEAGVATDVKPVLWAGIDANQTGLVQDSKYYLSIGGELSESENEDFMGTAISPTEIFFNEYVRPELLDLTGAIGIPELKDELSGIFELPTGDNIIDFGAYIHFDKTLDAVWSPTFTNPIKGKTITIIATGANAAYTLTLPTSVKGDISGWDGTKTNQLQIYCLDAATPVYSVTLLNW